MDLIDKKREPNAEGTKERLESMKGSIKNILKNLGEDPDREGTYFIKEYCKYSFLSFNWLIGLLETPLRMAKALMFFTQGYEQSLQGNNAAWWRKEREGDIFKVYYYFWIMYM